ncbi:dolichyl-phosphate beta-D-mannosyltransferase [Burkholderiaceae bacterium]
MTQVEVSVIVPTYNRAHRLARCLNSIPWRTHRNLEIVVVDDGSTDNTRDVLSAFITQDAPLRLVEFKVNRGVGAARVAGLSHARGGIVMWLDSDDEWLPGAYELLLSTLNSANHIEVVMGQTSQRIEPELAWPVWVAKSLRDEARFCHVFGAMAMDKSIFYRYPIDGSLRQSEDTDWIFRLQRDGITITQIPKQILTRWVGHDNLCHNKVQAKKYIRPVFLAHARALINKKRLGEKV